ncbi:probable proteasome inhibitor isoform X3 [Pyrus x bretschneideri]|uniref:probable proteasome inhibitor isoform X3 n=1 Tax=Pyrus x bretschneideri TaxID=225117 RepID=UPI002030487C|nr:probable proteasome inhibitor isoform X3 [Pyrus x bretschneideri]
MANDKSVMAVIRAARPNFRNNDDRVVFAVHASFLAAGYVLTAAGPPAFSDSVLSSSSMDEVGMEQWNELDGEYAFVYMNPEKGSKKVLVKCLTMNGKLLVDALVNGSSQPIHLEIDSEKSERSTTEPVSGPSGFHTRPSAPYTDPSGIVYPPVMPYGGSDVLPGPGAGVYPSRGDGSGSMLVGPHDPRWFGGVGDPGFSFDPSRPAGVPPGARFDPYGPPGVPGFEPNRFARNPRRPPGGGTHPDLEHFGSGSDFI